MAATLVAEEEAELARRDQLIEEFLVSRWVDG